MVTRASARLALAASFRDDLGPGTNPESGETCGGPHFHVKASRCCRMGAYLAIRPKDRLKPTSGRIEILCHPSRLQCMSAN